MDIFACSHYGISTWSVCNDRKTRPKMSPICATGFDWFKACRKVKTTIRVLARARGAASVWIAAGGLTAFRYFLKDAASEHARK